MKPYTTLLGCVVENLEVIPEGLVGMSFKGGNYTEYTAKGDLTKNAVIDTWNVIWSQDLNRNYIADFEVYGEKAANPTDGETSIFVEVV